MTSWEMHIDFPCSRSWKLLSRMRFNHPEVATVVGIKPSQLRTRGIRLSSSHSSSRTNASDAANSGRQIPINRMIEIRPQDTRGFSLGFGAPRTP